MLLSATLAFINPSAQAAADSLPRIWAFNVTGMATINRGEVAELNWSVSNNVTEVSISPGVGVVTGTSVTVSPEVTTTYVLTARNASGFASKSRKITVVVPPVITAFTATPESLVAGKAARLNWSATDATWYHITADNGSDPGQFFNRTTTVRPKTTTTYTLTAHNPAGTDVKTLTLLVVPAGPKPSISSFTASPATVVRGDPAVLSWAVNGATSLSISPGVGTVTGTSVTLNPTTSTTYVLTATNENGSVTRSVSVSVTEPQPRPVIGSFVASPATIERGGSATLSWAVEHAGLVSISGLGAVTGNSVTVTPAATTTYTLTVSNESGAVSANVLVTVNVPVPHIQAFQASPATITPGEFAELTWSVDGATQVSISPGPGVVTGSSVSVSPAQTTVYELIASNEGGSVTRSVTVTVDTPEPAPDIASFTASPASISLGSSTTLAWSVTGATTVSIAADAGSGPGVVTGSSITVSPIVNTVYTLTATNGSGVITTRTVAVTVTAAVPVINSFAATPASISAGASSTLAWSVTGATQLAISADTGTSPGNVTGVNTVVTPAATTVYTLTARNADGVAVTQSTTVTVTEAAPTVEITSFTASSYLIQAGEPVTLTWETRNAQSLYISSNRAPEPGDVRGRTSTVVYPTGTTRYVLSAFHSTYGTTSKELTVNVGPAPVPVINSFGATPGTISIGNATTLNWSVDGANEIAILADIGVSPGVVTGTSLSVSPAETTIYTLRARNAFGEVTGGTLVTVTGPTAPVIGSFTANPAFIQTGASSTLVWSVSGADSITISADVGASPGAVTGSSVSVAPAVSTIYTLTATNTIGHTTATAPVTIYTGGGSGVAHPRIWITPSRVTQLAQRAAANDPAWIALRDACDQWAAMPVRWPDESPATGYIHGGYQYFDYFRPVAELALAFQVVKESDQVRAGRYAAKAREILLKLSDPVRHGRESTDSGWSIRAYVPALALGYDWIYATLSDSDRAQIYTEINRWVQWFDANGLGRDFPNGNYFAGYYCAKALGALATEGENPQAGAMWDDWLNRIHYGMVQPYHASWLTGGGAPDGWNYGQLETINMLRPAAAAFTAKGLDLVGGLQPFTWVNGHATWMTHFTWPDMKTVSDRGFLYPQNNPSAARVSWATQYTGLMRIANAANAPVAQQYTLDLRAMPGRDHAETWVEFLFFDANAPAAGYRTDLSYRTVGDGQVAMRSSWAGDAVWASFQAGPYTGAPVSSEEFYDEGSLVIQRGDVQFVVNAWGAMFRHTPGTEDGEERQGGLTPFDQLYTEMFGVQTDGVTGGRRLFNTYYAFRTVSHPPIPGYYGQVAAGPDEAATTLSRFEEGGHYVLMRGTRLEDMYFDAYPISGWERSVLYVRPQLFVVYDRTALASASVDNWMSWHVAAAPAAQTSAPGTHTFDVVDTRSNYGGNLFRGRVTTLLPAGHTVNTVNLFDRNKVYRLDVRPGAPTAAASWLTVFDASGSAAAAGTATALTAANGRIVTGAVEGAVIAGVAGDNVATLFSTSGLPVNGTIIVQLPLADTYCIVADLVPNQSYLINPTIADNRLVVEITPGAGNRVATAAGTLTFDVSAGGSSE